MTEEWDVDDRIDEFDDRIDQLLERVKTLTLKVEAVADALRSLGADVSGVDDELDAIKATLGMEAAVR